MPGSRATLTAGLVSAANFSHLDTEQPPTDLGARYGFKRRRDGSSERLDGRHKGRVPGLCCGW